MIITSDDYNVQFDSTKNDYITCISKDDLKIIRIDTKRVGVFDPTARQENNKRLEIFYNEVTSPTFADVDELYDHLVSLKNSAGSSQNSLKAINDFLQAEDFASETTLNNLLTQVIGNSRYGDTATTTSIPVTSTSTAVISANTNRKELIIYNDSNRSVWLTFGVTATLNSGINLPSKGTWVETVYRGQVSGIVTTGTSDLRITEVTT